MAQWTELRARLIDEGLLRPRATSRGEGTTPEHWRDAPTVRQDEAGRHEAARVIAGGGASRAPFGPSPDQNPWYAGDP
jgi:hypothetical protein